MFKRGHVMQNLNLFFKKISDKIRTFMDKLIDIFGNPPIK